jgi:hypothetical protein
MPGTAVGLFIVDFVVRPFVKIFEKMPILMLLMLLILYGAVAYIVLKSAFAAESKNP